LKSKICLKFIINEWRCLILDTFLIFKKEDKQENIGAKNNKFVYNENKEVGVVILWQKL